MKILISKKDYIAKNSYKLQNISISDNTLRTSKIMNLISSLLVLMIIFGISTSIHADEAYKTYTYSYNHKELLSPHAYEYKTSYSGSDFGISKFVEPNDMFVDNNDNIYIADTKNNRIVILDKNFTKSTIINQFINPKTNNSETFNNPGGVFVTNDMHLYVADTDNERIVQIDARTGKCIRIIPRPKSKLLDDYVYRPDSLVVDAANRIYVVSKTVNVGVVALEADGSFSGFLGAKKVNPDISDIIWRYFMTKKQKENSIKQIPSSYNNIAIDSIGFLYVTTNTIKDWELQGYIYFKMKNDKFAPVRRLNTIGTDVLLRDGFYPPAGDANFIITNDPGDGASQIIDVALNKSGTYSILDQKRNKVFTYDDNGYLLHAFGGTGTQNGLVGRATAISYSGNDLLLLDAQNGKIIRYSMTKYGKTLNEAIELTNERKYQLSQEKWQEVLKLNNNMEMVYSANGQIYLIQEKYKEALEAFKLCNDVKNYSIAYAQMRKVAMRKYAVPFLFIILLLIIALLKMTKWIKKTNRIGQDRQLKQTLLRQLIYSHHILFHPFDGFYDMKYENRAGVKSGAIILTTTTMSFIFKNIFSGYIYNNGDIGSIDLMSGITTVLIPFTLWCVANWCLTTLMDGEGKAKDIFTATSYALVPMLFINIPVTIISNFVTIDEVSLLSFITSIFYGWSFLLILIGSMTIHGYTFTKNIVTSTLTVGGMGVILFIVLLFLNIIQKLIAFGVNIYTEIAFRL